MTHCVVTTASSRCRRSSFLRMTRCSGNIIGQGTVGDDDARGMRAGIAVGAFQLAGDVDQLVDLRVGVVFFLQIGVLLQGVVEGDAQGLGNHFGDLRDPRQRHIQGPGQRP